MGRCALLPRSIATEIYFKIGLTLYSWSTALQSNVWSGSFKNEYFDDPVSLIFRCTFNPNVVGATAGEPIPAAQRAKNRPAVVVIEGLFSVHFFAQLI